MNRCAARGCTNSTNGFFCEQQNCGGPRASDDFVPEQTHAVLTPERSLEIAEEVGCPPDIAKEIAERIRTARTSEEAQAVGCALIPLPDPFPNELLPDVEILKYDCTIYDLRAEPGDGSPREMPGAAADESPANDSPRSAPRAGLRLNIASGPNMFPGWQNLDRVDQQSYMDAIKDAPAHGGWPDHQVKLAEHLQAGRIEFRIHDLRHGFPEHANESVEAIYLGQMVEHLNPIAELPKFLAECFRMLVPGGKIRITTPDLAILLTAYMNGEMLKFAHEQPQFYWDALPSAQLSYLMFGACGPNCTFDNFEGHFAVFSQDWMRQLLETAGFVDVEFNGEKSAVFAECVDCGMSHSFGCEARKP